MKNEAVLCFCRQANPDYISIGALTKHLQAVDFSLQLPPATPQS